MIFSILLIFCLGVIQGSYFGNYPRFARDKGRLTIKGTLCIFPFSFRGEVYRTCAPGVNQPLPWCATSVKNDVSNAVDDWEICATSKNFPQYADRTHLSPTSPYWLDDVYQRRGVYPKYNNDLYYGRPYSGLDDITCKFLDRENCASLVIRERCPLMCNAGPYNGRPYLGLDDVSCKMINRVNCASVSIRERCPLMCNGALTASDVLAFDDDADIVETLDLHEKSDSAIDDDSEAVELLDLHKKSDQAFDDAFAADIVHDPQNKSNPRRLQKHLNSDAEEVYDHHSKSGIAFDDESAEELLNLHKKSGPVFDDDFAADEVDPHNKSNPYKLQKHLNITGFVPQSTKRAEAVCDPTCVNGECIASDICSCIAGWTGDICDESEAVCDPTCVNGECIASDICSCIAGWTGDICDEPSTASKVCHEDNGFILSAQCFKPFFDKPRDWNEANLKCQSEGLILAEPSDSVAVALRKYILDNYETTGDDHELWLGAKADGNQFVWQESGVPLLRNSPLFDYYSGEVGRCLELDVYDKEYKDTPNKPYDSAACSTKQLTLCEGFDQFSATNLAVTKLSADLMKTLDGNNDK